MSRFDIYATVHKGLRHALGGLASRLARADATDAPELAAIRETQQELWTLLRIHAEVEDRHIVPLVERYSAEEGARYRAEHESTDADLGPMDARFAEALAEALADDLAPEDRAEALARLRRAFDRFVAANLTHMSFEECEVLPLLWENMDDAAIIDVAEAMRADVPPPVLMKFLGYMIPAMNGIERAALFAGMKQSAPPEAFTAVSTLAKSVLEPADWEALSAEVQGA